MKSDVDHKKGGQGGFEPPTSRTQSENHTPRPLALTEPRGIRTPSLRVWNPTRCHCAMGSQLSVIGVLNFSYQRDTIFSTKKPAVGVEPTTPSLRSLCNNHYATRANHSRWRDSNSRPSAYKADAITTMLHRRSW